MKKIALIFAVILSLSIHKQLFAYRVLMTTGGGGGGDGQFLADRSLYPFVASNADGIRTTPGGWNSLTPDEQRQFVSYFTNKKVLVAAAYNGQDILFKIPSIKIPSNAEYLGLMIYSNRGLLNTGADLVRLKAKQVKPLTMPIFKNIRVFDRLDAQEALTEYDGLSFEAPSYEVEGTDKLDNVIEAIRYCVDNNKIISLIGSAPQNMAFFVPRYKAMFHYLREKLEPRYLNSDNVIFSPTTYGDATENRFTPETAGANTFTELAKWLIEQKTSTYIQPKIRSTSFENEDIFPFATNLTASFTVTHSVAIANVKLYYDGVLVGQKSSAPYTFSGGILNNLAEGFHTLKEVATDINGNIGEMTQLITVLGPPPIVPGIVKAGECFYFQGKTGITQNLGFLNVREGDVMKYKLNVQTTGVYDIRFRVNIQRSVSSGGTIILSDLTQELGRVTTILNDPKNPALPGFTETPDDVIISGIRLTQGIRTFILTFEYPGSGVKPQFDFGAMVFSLVGTSDPIPAITPSATSFCDGSSALLSSSNGGNSYKWFRGTTQVSTNKNYFATQGGVYKLEVTYASGTTLTSAPITLTENPLPVANISSPSTSFCSGASLVLTSSTGNTYNWVKNGTDLGVSTKTFAATTSGSYTVEITNTFGCEASSSPIDITENPLPVAAITSPSTSFCDGESLVLNSTFGASYEWFRGGVDVGITTKTNEITTGGSYKVEVTNGAGCKQMSDAYVVTIRPVPTATITSPSTSFCNGESLVLTSSFGASYKWLKGGVDAGITTKTNEVTTGGSYKVEVTNGAGCKQLSDAYVVTVNAIPAIKITNPTKDTSVTLGSYLVKSFSSSTNLSSVKYFVNGVLVQTINAAPYFQTVSLPTLRAFNVKIVATNALNCTNSDSVKITKTLATSLESVVPTTSEVSIYPNPSSDGKFQLSKVANWKVYNLQGTELKVGNSNQINLSEYLKGVYLIKVNEKMERVVID